jgi:hypothetical protein
MSYFTSSMLNMFRTLIHPSSGACDFSIVSPHSSCVLVSMCFGVSVWLGWCGILGWVGVVSVAGLVWYPCRSLVHGFHFFYAEHGSDINTSIIRSLRLFYCVTILVVCSCFDVCWSFGVDGCINVRNMFSIEEVVSV